MSLDIMFQKALDLHDAGRLDEAETIYRQLLETAPEHVDLLHLLGMIASQKGAFEQALPYLSKAVRLAPDAVACRFTLACALQGAGHAGEALEQYAEILKRDDSLPDTYSNMGSIYQQKGDGLQAERMFLKALEKKSDYAPAYVNLGVLHRTRGNFDDALSCFSKVITLAPDLPDGYAQKALTLRCAGRLEESLACYEKAVALDSSDAVVVNGMGVAYELAGETDKALECYNRALAINPRFADALNNRANVYVKQGRKWDAEDDFKQAVKIDSQYAEAYNNLGALLFSEERYEESLECYRKAFLINKSQPETMNNLAMAVKAAGDCEEAVALLFNALVLAPELKTVQYNLAETLYELYVHENKPDEARKLAEKWAKQYPEHAAARHLAAAFAEKSLKGADKTYVRELFDAFADTFDKTLSDINYRVPDLMCEAFQKLFPAGKKAARVLDAGCGTGLCGERLRAFAERLTGVDLSEKMIAKAAKKKCYDDLKTADVVAELSENKESFDAIVMGDVACYFGDLSELLTAAYAALAPDGVLLFTLEESDKKSAYVLQPSGRFAHNAGKTRALVEKQCGASVVSVEKSVLRTENGKDVAGMLFVVKKNGQSRS